MVIDISVIACLYDIKSTCDVVDKPLILLKNLSCLRMAHACMHTRTYIIFMVSDGPNCEKTYLQMKNKGAYQHCDNWVCFSYTAKYTI